MDATFAKLAKKAEKSFDSYVDFSDESTLAKTSHSLLTILDKFRIGPKVLMLLATFGFPEEKRDKIWKSINEAVTKHK